MTIDQALAVPTEEQAAAHLVEAYCGLRSVEGVGLFAAWWRRHREAEFLRESVHLDIEVHYREGVPVMVKPVWDRAFYRCERRRKVR